MKIRSVDKLDKPQYNWQRVWTNKLLQSAC